MSLVGSGEGQQGAGVYGHIFFHAGAYLADPSKVATTVTHIYDLGQSVFGVAQAEEEVAGNHAGAAVGKIMWDYIRNGSAGYKPLRAAEKAIKAELCE